MWFASLVCSTIPSVNSIVRCPMIQNSSLPGHHVMLLRTSLPIGLLCGSLVLLAGFSSRTATHQAIAQDRVVAQDREADNPITVRLASGRSFTAEIDSRTDGSQLWLRSQRGSAVLLRPIRWEQVVEAQVAGEQVSGDELRQTMEAIKQAVPPSADAAPARKQIVFSASGSEVGSDSSATAHALPLETDFTPPVRSLAITAAVANWDADVEVDGLMVHVYPLDDNGALVPVRGSLQVDLRGLRTGVAKRPGPFGNLGRWTRRVVGEDFGPDGTVYRLAFQHAHPEFDLSLASHGTVHVRLSVPGQGTFETTESTVRIRPFSPVRDQLQQATGRRFFPHERTSGGRR